MNMYVYQRPMRQKREVQMEIVWRTEMRKDYPWCQGPKDRVGQEWILMTDHWERREEMCKLRECWEEIW